MRMLLTSGGVVTPSIEAALVELLGRPIASASTAVVLDAILPFAGDKSVLLRHLQQYRDLGWRECDILSLLSGPRSVIESRLRNADVIYGYGGSNHWLAHAWRTSGMAPLLRELLDEKVYVGISAGSMIFSRLHAEVVEAFDDQAEVDMLQLEHVAPALPLFDWVLMPHLGASFLPHQTDEWAAASSLRLGAPVWYLDDRSALRLRGPDADPEVVSDGHWLHLDGRGHLLGSR